MLLKFINTSIFTDSVDHYVNSLKGSTPHPSHSGKCHLIVVQLLGSGHQGRVSRIRVVNCPAMAMRTVTARGNVPGNGQKPVVVRGLGLRFTVDWPSVFGVGKMIDIPGVSL